MGDLVRLRSLFDPLFEALRLGAGGPIFGSAVDVELAGGLDVDATDVVDLGGFAVAEVLAFGRYFASGFTMEADLVFMNPASVGWRSADDWASFEAFLRGMVAAETSNPRTRLDIQEELCGMTEEHHGLPK